MSTQTAMRRKRSRADLVHLRLLPATQPSTKIEQVAWAWAEIQALAAGMKLKEIWEAANRHGLEMSYAQFRVYVSRSRWCLRQSKTTQTQPPPTAMAKSDNGMPAPPSDPFRNLREQREKAEQSSFEYDPFSTNKNSFDRLRGNRMTRVETSGNETTASVHLVLHGKGGVGKSFVSAILAQYFRTKSASTHCLNFWQKPAHVTLLSQSATVCADEGKAQTTRRTTALRHARPHLASREETRHR